MNRRDFLKTAGVGLAALSLPACRTSPAAATPAAGKPNIIFILSDDVGLGDISCYGSDYFKTPHIDALARGGTRFEYCYATPLCGPSRCEALTGRYPFRTGLISNQSANAIAPDREVMIPTVLKKAGYVTASVGKWGQMCLGPGEWGFDEYITFKGSGHYWRSQTPSYTVNGKERVLRDNEYLPDTMHAFLVDFLARHQHQPFFVYYPMSHVHGPFLRTPDSKPGEAKADLYADNIAYMDKLVGRLIAELERLGLRQNTVVLFSGDNGTARFGADRSALGGRKINGQKASMLEGGSRVPLIANWPGTTPAGAVNHDLTDFSDYFATCAELGGAALPAGVTLDSRSYAPQLRGQQGTPREWVYVELNGKSYAREARYKLTNSGELFDLKDAPFVEAFVPADTPDAGARAARQRLQAVLDQHPAAPANPNARKNKPNQPQRKKRRPQQV